MGPDKALGDDPWISPVVVQASQISMAPAAEGFLDSNMASGGSLAHRLLHGLWW